jgi:hypothetical protein
MIAVMLRVDRWLNRHSSLRAWALLVGIYFLSIVLYRAWI